MAKSFENGTKTQNFMYFLRFPQMASRNSGPEQAIVQADRFFIILNLEPKHRSRAASALISAFIPGWHENAEFDSFLTPIVLDLVSLQNRTQVMCADGKIRLLKAFVF